MKTPKRRFCLFKRIIILKINSKIFSSLIKILLWILIAIIYYQKAFDLKFIQDDAFTSLRYIKNILNGQGLVFNPGERVEGYTNFLWVMILSTIKLIGNLSRLNINLEELTQTLSTFFGLTFLIAVYVLSNRIFNDKKYSSLFSSAFSFLIVLMVLYTTPFMYWSVSGMETSLFATLTIITIYLFIESYHSQKLMPFVIVSILNSLLRPEGFIFFFILIFIRTILNFIEKEPNKLLPRIVDSLDPFIKKTVFIYLSVMSLYILFRLIYYGYPFPNTFYAKTEFNLEFLKRGWNYLTEFVQDYFMYGFMFVPIAFLFNKKYFEKETITLLLFSVIYILLIVLIGGDVLPTGRFFLPILPLIYILFISSINQIIQNYSQERWMKYFYGIMIIVLVIFSTSNYKMQKPKMLEKRAYEIGLVSKMKIYADWVSKKYDNKNSVVALSTIGAFSFYSNSIVIDLVGLTDEYIAHHPKVIEGINEELPVLWKERHYNADYVLSRKPDFIIFPAGAKPSAFAECAIFVNDNFYHNYYTQLFFADGFGQLLPIFTRRENVRKDSINCNISFLKNYINANNILISLIKNINRTLLKNILEESDEVIQKCPNRISDANAIKGMAFYHLGNYLIAKKYFETSVGQDESNSIANFYLLNTLMKLDDKASAEKIIPLLLKYSPDVLTNYFDSETKNYN